jgi:hypothetical protein
MEITILGTESLQRAGSCGLSEVVEAIADEEVPE